MLACDYIDPSIPFLKDTDSLEKGLEWLSEFKLLYLPVVDAKTSRLLGLVSEGLLIDNLSKVSDLSEVMLLPFDFLIDGEDLIFEILEKINNFDYDVYPVLKDEVYEGLITRNSLIKGISEFGISTNSDHGFVVLRMSIVDYSLNDLSRVVESNGSKVLSSCLKELPKNPGFIDVLLKINTEDLSLLVLEFKQLNYEVIFLKSSLDIDDTFEGNYKNLIKYLDI
jgi:CBS domain-containing protein